MFEAVARECGMVAFDVDFDVLLQAVTAQEAVNRGDVVVVLVLGGFARFGFDEDGALEADFVFVFDHHVHETPELVQLLADARVEQGFVTFAATPEHIVGTAEFQCGVHRFFDLQGGEGEDFRVGVGGRAAHEAPVAEQVGGAPQEFDAGVLLLPGQHIDHLVQIVDALARGRAFGGDIAVMKAVIRRAEFAEKLEGGVGLEFGRDHRV